MLDNLIDMFNYSSKVADQWEDIPADFNLMDADLDLRVGIDSDLSDTDSSYSDEDETESLHHLSRRGTREGNSKDENLLEGPPRSSFQRSKRKHKTSFG